jgi:hypothetical protein
MKKLNLEIVLKTIVFSFLTLAGVTLIVNVLTQSSNML